MCKRGPAYWPRALAARKWSHDGNAGSRPMRWWTEPLYRVRQPSPCGIDERVNPFGAARCRVAERLADLS
jgi:hypothetical protein